MVLLESSWHLSLYISELLRHHRNLWTDSYQAAVAFNLSSVKTVIVELPNMHHASQSSLQYIFVLLHYSLETILLEAFIYIQMLPKTNYEYVHVMSYLLRTVKLIFI